MSYHVRDRGKTTTTLTFDTVQDAYAYVLAARDFGLGGYFERWGLVERTGGAEREVVRAGALVEEAELWQSLRDDPRYAPQGAGTTSLRR